MLWLCCAIILFRVNIVSIRLFDRLVGNFIYTKDSQFSILDDFQTFNVSYFTFNVQSINSEYIAYTYSLYIRRICIIFMSTTSNTLKSMIMANNKCVYINFYFHAQSYFINMHINSKFLLTGNTFG